MMGRFTSLDDLGESRATLAALAPCFEVVHLGLEGDQALGLHVNHLAECFDHRFESGYSLGEVAESRLRRGFVGP
jgi:hypothetical protein